ncbi:hypothetical protein HAP48_0035700 [Bradyrhizobium septentrionale]|uniref:hypothetical protein n=1 Tax=Bradyrhizobium septentrionale TaxID=1404411 RepID=UPI001CD005B0|nr:hypothetical protein [Bradyrhizobium septentrionale]UGY20873.1 hypothetical protein HAP48_0035700 [Bradyrhizobium septentrionale]
MPDGCQHLVAADHAVAGADQELEEVEDLRLDRHQGIATAQLPALRVEDQVVEMVSQIRWSGGRRLNARRNLTQLARSQNHDALKDKSTSSESGRGRSLQ